MPGLTRHAIAEQDRQMLERQANFRLAADAVTAALARFPEVVAVALIGSAARPLCREVPRFSPFRRLNIPIWHECKDIDLAVWLDRLDGLHALNQARGDAVRRLWCKHQIGIAHHQVEIFVLRAGCNDYLGRLCTFAQCPKGKRECLVPGCGRHLFLRQHEDFTFWPDALNEEDIMRLYDRQFGILRRAADTPAVGRECHAPAG